ncbi:MAG: CRISPR-associated protein Cas5 [Thermomicrobium sp.]
MVAVVRCDVCGKFAHFRRFYTNSSSLSYPIPPPSTIRGLVAAALGLERDEYSERLRTLRVAIGVRQPLRMVLQSVNALMVDSGAERQLRGFEDRTQIPTQFLLPETRLDDWDTAALRFHLILVPPDGLPVDQLAAALQAPIYPPALGTAYCLGWIENVEIRQATIGQEDLSVADYLGALDASQIEEFILDERIPHRLSRDRYPVRLDKQRRLVEARDLIADLRGYPIRCRYRGPWLEIESERWALID